MKNVSSAPANETKLYVSNPYTSVQLHGGKGKPLLNPLVSPLICHCAHPIALTPLSHDLALEV